MTIRTKLAATMAVPLVALAAFAAFQVRGAYDRADQVKRQAALATSATGPAGALSALETERDYETLWQIGAENVVDGGRTKTSGDATARTNVALSGFRALLHDLGGDAASNYQSTLTSVSTRLSDLRQDAEKLASTGRGASPVARAKQANAIFDRYTVLIGQLLDVDQRSFGAIDDAQLRNGAELLNSIARQNDIEKQIAVKAILATGAHDTATGLQVQRLAGLQAAGDADLHLRADGPYAGAVLVMLTAKDRLDIVNKLDAVAKDPLHANTTQLFQTVSTASKLWSVPQSNVSDV
ncbi:MAG TPA: hypothetical protein VEP49_09740, partial [Acidimicrobiia bacterium]|nr:hypothetical protein [Acidimicrobiia bacterium]